MGGRACRVEVRAPGRIWAVPRHAIRDKLKVPPPLGDGGAGLLDFCGRVSLFSALSKERLVQLCRGARLLQLEANEPIFREGK